MKLFLIIIVLAFIVFAVSIYFGWIFTKPNSKTNEEIAYSKYHDDHDEYWF